MNKTANEFANEIGAEIVGNSNVVITHPDKIEQAEQGAISFLANMKYEEFLYQTNASAVIIPKSLKIKSDVSATLLLVDDPYSSFVYVLNDFNSSLFEERGIHAKAFVHETAQIGENVYIGPFAVIEQGAVIGEGSRIEANCTIGKYAQIGADCQLFSSVSVYHYCHVGDRAIFHSGVVIGSDGFGFAPSANGSYTKIPQVGNVEIGNDVEIGANTTIDRATMGSTKIGNGVKIDNLVQIGHNVVIDDHTVIAAQAGISGSTKLGKYVVVGGQAGFVGHIEIADKTKINAQSGVSKSIKDEGQALSGSPAFPWREELKSQAMFRILPELEQRIRNLEDQNKNQ